MGDHTPRHPSQLLVAQAAALKAVSTAAESFIIPAAPDLIPEGPWEKVAGGLLAPKGFKATGGSLLGTGMVMTNIVLDVLWKAVADRGTTQIAEAKQTVLRQGLSDCPRRASI